MTEAGNFLDALCDSKGDEPSLFTFNHWDKTWVRPNADMTVPNVEDQQ